MRAGWVLALAATALWAETPLLQNDGKPIAVDYRCTEDDIQWGGMSCNEDEPCPIYLELSDVQSVGNRVFAIGNLHSDATTLYSVLLASEDAGKTWREAFQRLRGAGFDHIQFIDFENGWISGGTLHPLPQDPFFLLTTDGGKTWQKRPIFDEPHGGAIQQFWFSSRKNGMMLLERTGETSRYALYESPNGGETWMVREMSDKPQKLKRAAAPPDDWRIRADAASKSFHIERRMSDRWTPIAAFAVSAGQCKPGLVPAAPSVETKPQEEPKPVPSAPVAPRKPPTLRKEGRSG
jgi:hypothetical protein